MPASSRALRRKISYSRPPTRSVERAPKLSIRLLSLCCYATDPARLAASMGAHEESSGVAGRAAGFQPSRLAGRLRPSCFQGAGGVPEAEAVRTAAPSIEAGEGCRQMSRAAGTDKKKASRSRLAFGIWWRRRESNPRPQELRPWFYMLIPVF